MGGHRDGYGDSGSDDARAGAKPVLHSKRDTGAKAVTKPKTAAAAVARPATPPSSAPSEYSHTSCSVSECSGSDSGSAASERKISANALSKTSRADYIG